jgi:hypothetical protein
VLEGKVIFRSSDGTRFGRRITVETDGEGRFLFENAAKGESVLTVLAGGYAPDLALVVVSAGGADARFTLGAGRTIGGRIVDSEGAPVSGARVGVASWRGERTLAWETLTDAAGRFEWRRAPEDPIR